MNILIAEMMLEVSTFNPAPTTHADFVVTRGEAFLAARRGRNLEVAGALGIFDGRADVTVTPTYAAHAVTSGGRLTTAAWRQLATEFLEAVRQAEKPDGVYVCMHGAMDADGEHDPEGFLLAEMRAILGERVPVVVSLDLHGILTDKMLQHADAVVPYHTYPHTDFASTGARAARLLLKVMDGAARPVTARVAIPALVRGDELITATGYFGRQLRMALALENHPAGLSAGMFVGNPFTDVPELRSNAVVVTNNDVELAQREALTMARDFWDGHERMQVPLTSLGDAVRIARETTPGTTILVDAADATSSGASGDSNAILRALRDGGYARRALIPIVDAPAVRAAFVAGVGADITVPIGGALDRARFEPIGLQVRVRMLSDGSFVNESDGATWLAGDTAVLAAQNFTIIATSRPVSLYNRSLFLAHGCDPATYDCVIVKSPQCEPHMFRSQAARYVDVDAPGSTSANVRGLGHTICARPLWPLDNITDYQPMAQLFRRG